MRIFSYPCDSISFPGSTTHQQQGREQMQQPIAKKVNPALMAYVEVRNLFFDDGPKATLQEIKDYVIEHYELLPIVDISIVFMLIEKDYLEHDKATT